MAYINVDNSIAIHSLPNGTVNLSTEPIVQAEADIHVFAAWSSDCDLDTFSSLVLRYLRTCGGCLARFQTF